MFFTESLQKLVDMRYVRMAVFLLECRENEERQADFPSKDASSSVLEMMASFNDHMIMYC